MKNHSFAKRMVTGIIGIPVLIALIGWGSETIFLVIVMLTAGLALLEFYTIHRANHAFVKALAVIACLMIIWFVDAWKGSLSSFHTNGMGGWIAWSAAFITLAVIASLLLNLFLFPRHVVFVKKPVIALTGILYVGLLLSYVIPLRGGSDGKSWVFFTLLLVWLGDTGAYTVGKLTGRRKLWTAVSPNKTVEGSLGGLLASLIAAVAATPFFFNDLSIVHGVWLALGIGVMGQLGDLCESAFKRANQVHDSGNLLPGHGGMLDRIDSLLFAVPFVYYYKILIL